MITLHFTDQEAHNLMNVLTQVALPFNVSQPLVQKLGQAIAFDQQMQRQKAQADPANWPQGGAMQGVGMAVEGGGVMGQFAADVANARGEVRPMRSRPVPVLNEDEVRAHTRNPDAVEEDKQAESEKSDRERLGLPEHDA